MMQVSTARQDITPGIGYPMAGYGTTVGQRLSDGVNEPLQVRCVVLWDDDVPKVIVSADVLAFGHEMHQQIRSRVLALGVATEDFVLNATHTHNGPVLIEKLHPYIAYGLDDLTQVTAYSENLVTMIVSVAQAALMAPRTPCTLDYAVFDENFSANREGLTYVERDVPTLVARALDGQPRAVLFSYGAHPVAGNASTLFDPDYPGQAIKTIESVYPGCFAEFILGPAGDQNPLRIEDFELADEYGVDLGLTVADGISQVGRELSGPLSTAYIEASLPFDVVDSAGQRAGMIAAFTARETNPALPRFYQRHGEIMRMIVADTAVPLESTLALPIQRWRFDGEPGLSMIFCGGEVVSGYAVYFRFVHGGSEELWFTAYANEVAAYIPTDEMLARPSYGAGFDQDFPKVGGGSMTVYAHVAHFSGPRFLTGVDGVEQALIDEIEALL